MRQSGYTTECCTLSFPYVLIKSGLFICILPESVTPVMYTLHFALENLLLCLHLPLLHTNLIQVHKCNFDRDIPEVGKDLMLKKKKKMRCHLQIYTPPLAHCTSLKPEAACSGFISVPAHTGCIRPHMLIYLSCLSERLFPPRERWGSTRFTHIWDEIHFGKSTCNCTDRKETLLLPSPLSSPLCLPPQCHHLESGSLMNVHIVCKYISVAPASNLFVLYFGLVLLISSLLWVFPANWDYFNLFLGFGMSILFFKNKCDNQPVM